MTSFQDQKKKDPEGDPERGDAILKRMLKTPPKPHKDMKKGKVKGSGGTRKTKGDAAC